MITRGIAAGAAAAVLAFVGAPLSVDALMWTGVDDPRAIGFQLTVAVAGAVGMAVGVAAARWWRWVLAAGVVAVGIALLVDAPPAGGISVQVRQTTDQSTSDPGIALVWAGVLAAGSGALLIAALCAARRSPGWAGVVACAGYFGVSLSGSVRDEAAVRVGVIAVAAIVLLVVAAREDADEGARPAGMLVLLTAVPTGAVALLGEKVGGTAIGLVIGLVLVVAAVVAAGADRALVAGLGLLLAAPFVLLVLLHSVVAGEIWYAWPLTAAGVVAGVAGSRFAGMIVAAAVVPMGCLALGGVDGPVGRLAIWGFLVLVLAGLAAGATTAARASADLPVLGALAVTAAVGTGHVLTFVNSAAEAGVYGALGRGGQIAAVVGLAAASVLLHLGGSRKTEPATVGGA